MKRSLFGILFVVVLPASLSAQGHCKTCGPGGSCISGVGFGWYQCTPQCVWTGDDWACCVSSGCPLTKAPDITVGGTIVLVNTDVSNDKGQVGLLGSPRRHSSAIERNCRGEIIARQFAKARADHIRNATRVLRV